MECPKPTWNESNHSTTNFRQEQYKIQTSECDVNCHCLSATHRRPSATANSRSALTGRWYDDLAPRMHIMADRNSAKARRQRTYLVISAYFFFSPLESRPHKRLMKREHWRTTTSRGENERSAFTTIHIQGSRNRCGRCGQSRTNNFRFFFFYISTLLMACRHLYMYHVLHRQCGVSSACIFLFLILFCS